jgi:hypothetical protein
MIERLLSYAILLKYELITLDNYNMHLDEIFLQYPDDDLLLELQWCSTDSKKTIDAIWEYSRDVEIVFDIFGRFLLGELKVIYKEMDINSFGAKAYSVWNLLPESINQTEPFWTLSYADDPLSWGDVKQTRELYEKMFKYYESNDAVRRFLSVKNATICMHSFVQICSFYSVFKVRSQAILASLNATGLL